MQIIHDQFNQNYKNQRLLQKIRRYYFRQLPLSNFQFQGIMFRIQDYIILSDIGMSAIIQLCDQPSIRKSFEQLSIKNSIGSCYRQLGNELAKKIPQCLAINTFEDVPGFKSHILGAFNNKQITQSCPAQYFASLNIQETSINITICFLRNGLPSFFPSESIKILINRMLIKSSFSWDLWIKCTLKQTKQLNWSFQFNCPELLSFFIQNRKRAVQLILKHWNFNIFSAKKFYAKLLPILNDLPRFLENQEKNREFLQQIQVIKKVVNTSTFQNLFTNRPNSRFNLFQDLQNFQFEKDIKTNNLMNSQLYYHKPFLSQRGSNHLNLKELGQFYLNDKQVQKRGDNTITYQYFTHKKLRQLFTTAIKYPVQKNFNRFENQYIFSQFYIVQPQRIKWIPFYQGGFGSLKAAKVRFLAMEPSDSIENLQQQTVRFRDLQKRKKQQIIERNLILKTQKTDYCNKQNHLKWQVHIIQSLGKKKCGFIPRYFYTKQKLPFLQSDQSFIFTQYYKGKSLQYWKQNNDRLTTSMYTKLTLLYYVSYGLNFLHENNIIHMDLKPSNILLDKKFITKLADYGQSFNEEVRQIMQKKGFPYRPGFTIPYAPPQIFLKKRNINTKCDIFSFGVLMFQVFFGFSIFGGCSPNRLQQLYIKAAQNTQRGVKINLIAERIFICPESSSLSLFSELGFILLNLILRCLDSQQNRRPYLQWVIIILKQFNRCCQQYYSL